MKPEIEAKLEFMDPEIRRRLHALSDLQSSDLLWFVIGYFHLGEDERWPEAVDKYFEFRSKYENGFRLEVRHVPALELEPD